jgi:pyruvate dehydrogenase E2 component (dihydrolipoamide acetyltransferase)
MGAAESERRPLAEGPASAQAAAGKSTVQADQTLYLTVIRDTQAMSAPRFIEALGAIQRQAMGHKLKPEQMAGATVAFSSMARWNVSRHIPLLPSCTALMIVHAAPRGTGRPFLPGRVPA